ncbi:hypothetical protein BC832DRAFT_393036 [Gaertneriomyces semiglobifer]|nr:hypothetical protein BC832DRAFT_393036 [Gaertneriomyces semiglobifer]
MTISQVDNHQQALLSEVLAHYKVTTVEELEQRRVDPNSASFWQDRQWAAWKYQTKAWKGQCTEYDHQGNITDEYNVERSFWMESCENADVVHHARTHWHTQAGTLKDQFALTKELILKPFGCAVDPKNPTMRAVMFPGGNCSFSNFKVEYGAPVGGNLILAEKHCKVAVTAVFATSTDENENGSVAKLSIIRDDTRGWPSPFWSDTTKTPLTYVKSVPVDVLPSTSLSGLETILRSDLSINVKVDASFDSSFDGPVLIQFVDNVFLHIYQLPQVGQGLKYRVLWIRDGGSRVEQLMVEYDVVSRLQTLTSGSYTV